MNPRSRTLAILLGAVVLAGAAGIGVAASGDSAGAGTTPSSIGRPGGGGPGGFDLSALADELGLSVDKVEAAPDGSSPDSTTRS